MLLNFRKYFVTSALALASTAMLQAQPAINSAVNASSYQNEIAPGSWFVVFGRNMGPAQLALHTGAVPFPEELSGTQVSLTPASGGTAIRARVWYTSAGQLAALLPSSATPGDYDVRVTYNGQQSGPQRVRVVERNFGFATQAQNGQGPAQATIGDTGLNRFTTGTLGVFQARPARAGDVVVLWGTGLGADASSDLNGATSGDRTAAANVRVLLGGVEITPAYAGRSNGSPGLDQINFVVPANVQTGCFVPLQVRAGGRLSNSGSLAIAGAGQNACQSGTLSPAQLSRLDQGGTMTFGSISISKIAMRITAPAPIGTIDSTTESASAGFMRLNIAQVASSNLAIQEIGQCMVFRRRGTQDELVSGTTGTVLDAGARLTLSGPGANNVAMPKDESGDYGVTLYSSGFGGFGGQGQPTITNGTYTVAGTGGADVGAFTASLNVPGNFSWSNQNNIADPISRSNNLVVNWTGGGDGLVSVVGISGTATNPTSQNPIIDAGVFTCTAPASAGTLSVPTSVLQQLPAVQNSIATGGAGVGMLMVTATPNPAASSNSGTFTAPLTAGGSLDAGFFTYAIGSTKLTGWQ